MKKVLFFMFLFAAAASAVLYFGWVRVPENNSALFFSSITGYEKTIIHTGKFHWRWQKLIPKNSKIYLVNTAGRKAEFSIKGKLPSADTYTEAMPGSPDFSWSGSFTAFYKLNDNFIHDFIVNITSGEETDAVIDPEKTKAIHEITDTQIEIAVKNNIENGVNKIISSTDEITAQVKEIFSKEFLSSGIMGEMENIELLEFEVINYTFPDIRLYRIAAKQYEEISSIKSQQIIDSKLKSAVFETDLEKRLEILEKYGELLTRYPILLEYLKINPEMDIIKESAKNPGGR
ncbi:MAG: hypothetical protein RBT69_03135 [Spirochaetia bacterium]|jgi:hypothetical protein|nr:hypothetical protein [Spirochaetia bacterium]